jgi:eukaryotic-like serine/threonine-protein kinase
MSLATGTSLGPYTITSFVGRGGMGEVYRARDPRLDRDVAIKTVRHDLASDPERIRRFEQEARAASALNHPNILSIYDVGVSGATRYIAMEWIDGETLGSLLKKSHVPVRRAIEIARELAEGLAKAHAAGIVHRDLKPDNVMVNVDGLVKILDFGLAKLHRAEAVGAEVTTIDSATGLGIVMGSVGYMSPEQALGRTADYRADQFALGVILYEMLGKQHPFARGTDAHTIAATLEAKPEPLESLVTDLPAHLPAIVGRCLAKEPGQRYESTRDLARDLKDLLGPGSGPAPRPSGSVSERRRAGWSGKRLLAGAAAAAVLVAGTAGGMWYSRPSTTSATRAEAPLLAVLPFRSLSGTVDQDAFADGMTDEIRGRLGKLSGLRLLSRNAIGASADVSLARLSAEHGVGSVVEGRVRRDGNRVRIAVELVSASNQQTLWSDQYDRMLDDVFAVQSDVAVRVAEALQARISPEERARVDKRPTTNVEAYGLYLESQSGHSSYRPDSNLKAIGLLKRAIELDPAFALARARLAYRTLFLASGGDRATAEEGLRLAREAVHTDPLLAEAHFALASSLDQVGQVAQARTSYLRALELAPSNSSAIANLSILEANSGHYDEALRWARRGFAINGKGGNDYYHLLLPYLQLADAVSVRGAVELAVRRFPDVPRLQIMYAAHEHQQGDTPAALARMRRLSERFPQNPEVTIALSDLAFFTREPDAERMTQDLMTGGADRVPGGWFVTESMRTRFAYLLQQRGEAARARDLLAQSERAADKLPDDHPAYAIERAAVYALQGKRERALASIERLTAPIDVIVILDRNPTFASIRSDARFQSMLTRVRRELDAQRARAAEGGLLDLTRLIGAY